MNYKIAKSAFIGILISLCLTITGWAGQKEPSELTLAESIELALENNLDLALITLDLEQAEVAVERAKVVGDSEMIEEAEKELEKVSKAYMESRRALMTTVQSTYLEVLDGEANVANRLTATERAADQLKIDQSKYTAGLLSSLDVMRAENSLANAKTSYQSAIVTLATKRLEFNQLLGLPLQQEVVLTERLLLDFVAFEMTLDECYELALDVDSTVLTAKQNLVKAQDGVMAAHSPFTPQVELDKALVAEQKAKIQLEKAKQSLYFKIRNDFCLIHDTANTVSAKEREMELERQILLSEEGKYAAGVISNAQIVAQQEKVARVEQEYGKALLDYNLRRTNLLQSIGRPEFVWGENHEE